MFPVSGWSGWPLPKRANVKASEKHRWWRRWGSLSRFSTRRAGSAFLWTQKSKPPDRYYEQFGFVPMPFGELELSLKVKTIHEALTS
jgi:hypothetical protein